jgi:hypothetical protein
LRPQRMQQVIGNSLLAIFANHPDQRNINIWENVKRMFGLPSWACRTLMSERESGSA